MKRGAVAVGNLLKYSMKNFFTLFSLPIEFSLDLDLLERKYFSFQKQFHPDRAGIAEIENSININEAYEVLRNPLRRAIHILQINDIDLEKDESTIKPDLETLEAVLEIQEKILNLSDEEILLLKQSLNSEIKFLLEKAALHFAKKEFVVAAQLVIKARYFNNITKNHLNLLSE